MQGADWGVLYCYTNSMDGQDKNKGAKAAGMTPLMMGLLVVAILVAGGLGIYAWRQIEEAKAIPVADILADLRTYDGRMVHVKGKVTSTMNLMVKWFELDDGTATITVVTERGLPTIGEEVEVDGQVDELFNLGGISKTVIMELPERE